jgi:hypothetical protein
MEPGSEERGLAEARFAGTMKSMERGDGVIDTGVNAFASFFDTPVNIGTAIGGALNPNMTAKQALAMQGAYREAQGKKFPKTQFVSSIAGDIATGGLIIKGGAKALTKGGAGELVEKVGVFTKGKGVKGALSRILVNSSVGAAEGGIVEGLRRGETLDGAMLGLLNGPAGEALALLPKVTAALTPAALKDVMRDTQGKGLKILAEKLDLPHKEMAARWSRFSTIFGRPPSIAELTDDAANAELRDIVTDSTASAVAARKGIDVLEAGRAREVSEAVTRGIPTATVQRQTQAQTRIADKMFAKVRGENFEFEADDIMDLLEDADLKKLLPARLNKEIGELADAATDEAGELVGSVTLDGTTVDRMRKALARKADFSNPSNAFPEHFADLGGRLDEIASGQSDTYRSALDQFAKRARRIGGIKAGRKIVTGGEGTSEIVEGTKQTIDPQALAGQRQGIRSKLSDEALGGPAAATKVSKGLAEDVGLQDRLTAALPEKQAAELIEVGEVGTRAAKGLRALDPGTTSHASDDLLDVRDASIATLPGIPDASRILAIGRIISKKHSGIDKSVAKSIARNLFDPAKSDEVIELMLANGFKEADIKAIFIAGQAVGSTVQALNE